MLSDEALQADGRRPHSGSGPFCWYVPAATVHWLGRLRPVRKDVNANRLYMPCIGGRHELSYELPGFLQYIWPRRWRYQNRLRGDKCLQKGMSVRLNTIRVENGTAIRKRVDEGEQENGQRGVQVGVREL
jgi:hypothetical protein